MIKSAAAAKRLLKEILTKHIINENLPAGMLAELEDYIFSLPRFSGHRGCNFIIKMAPAYGARRVKALHIITAHSGFALPVFASQLSQPKKAKSTKSTRAEVIAAMREAIRYQIDEYRAELRELRASVDKNSLLYKELIICPLTRKRLIGACHVDHWGKPFIQIADEWLASLGFEAYSNIMLNRGRLPNDILQSWQDYHKKHAKLQLVSKSANLKKGASGYISRFAK